MDDDIEYEEPLEETLDVILDETPDAKPELKRLYQQHPECNLDYIEQVKIIERTPF